jgi:hypothetical protein
MKKKDITSLVNNMLLSHIKLHNKVRELEENSKVQDKMIMILWKKINTKNTYYDGEIGNLYGVPLEDVKKTKKRK